MSKKKTKVRLSEFERIMTMHRDFGLWSAMCSNYRKYEEMRNRLLDSAPDKASECWQKRCEYKDRSDEIIRNMEQEFVELRRSYLKAYLASYLAYTLAADCDDLVGRWTGHKAYPDFQNSFRDAADAWGRIALQIGSRNEVAAGLYDELTEKIETDFRDRLSGLIDEAIDKFYEDGRL